MKKILLCLLIGASFSAHARGYSSMPRSLQRTPSAHSYLFAPQHHARPNLRGRPLHELPLSKRRKLHREGLDNTVSAFI